MKRGPKPSHKVHIRWSQKFAYAIGLLVSDGCLSKDGRHIVLTSKDKEQLMAFNECLGLTEKICEKYSGSGNVSCYVQFSDVVFYKFLLQIGLTPAKSKTISAVHIPKKYFFHFLRGYFDGDGCSYSYHDSIWRNSYRFYVSFASGSEKYVVWLRNRLMECVGLKGSINRKKGSSNVQLKYAKREAVILVKKMYYRNSVCLERKRAKILDSLKVIRHMSEW